MKYNIYCDESCHLPNDDSGIMIIGGIECINSKVPYVNEQLRLIKEKNNVYKFAEIKWTKVSKSELKMYKEMVDLFFDSSFLTFRCVIATGKKDLSLSRFGLNYDNWYYRIYYLLLREMISIDNEYSIYLDIKDSNGQLKIKKLQSVLNRTLYDFSDTVVKKVQEVRSDQVQILQLTDLIIGAISYKNRNLNTSSAKNELANYISKRASRPLTFSTPKAEEKFNLFKWEPRRV